MTVTVIIIITRPWPAFGRLGLGGSSGGYSFHGYTFHASLRAFGAQLDSEAIYIGTFQLIIIILTIFHHHHFDAASVMVYKEKYNETLLSL